MVEELARAKLIKRGADRHLLQGLKSAQQLSNRLKEVWTEFAALRNAIEPVWHLFSTPEDDNLRYSEAVKHSSLSLGA